MINLDKFTYQELAKRIELYRNAGNSWVMAQAIALADMKRLYEWKP